MKNKTDLRKYAEALRWFLKLEYRQARMVDRMVKAFAKLGIDEPTALVQVHGMMKVANLKDGESR